MSWLAGRAENAVELLDGTTRLDPSITDALQVRTLHRTLRVRNLAVGVLRVASHDGLTLSADRARLLDALAYYAALGVERVRLVATAERAEAERQVEALRSSLLMAVSHDLRTPLTTIKGIAQEIAAGASSTDRAAIIEEEADRLDALVGDLLELSRIQAGAVRPVSAVNTADEVIGAALQRAQGLLGRHDVVVSLSDDVLAARFDFSQTQRIVVNLLENAAKYSPPGSRIEVAASRDATSLHIAVGDEGPGVPVGEEERIFEAFHRPVGTPPDVRGTGLGLSIARGLAEAQGGTVMYRKRTGVGAMFTLTLPVVDAPAEIEPADIAPIATAPLIAQIPGQTAR
jgi:two-component system sensor histidine kinase KdpD